MDLTTQLHLAAGLGALVLGAASILRGSGRSRNRLFALLCGALALWNLGVAGHNLLRPWQTFWPRVFLLGSCAAAPLGLHLSRTLSGQSGTASRIGLAMAYATAGALWISTWTPLYRFQLAWNLTAALILLAILLSALWVLLRKALSLPAGPERDAHRVLLLGATTVVLGGLSDLIPRGATGFPRIGPAALLLFLFVVSAIVIRHRFLDIDTFLAQAVALLVGAAAASLLLYGVGRASRDRIFPLFLATLLVLTLAGPIGRALRSGARSLLGPDDPVARALLAISRRLPGAQERSQVWGILEEALVALPGEARVAIYVRRPQEEEFRPFYRAGTPSTLPSISKESALPRLLEEDRFPVTFRFLEEEAREARGTRAELARDARREFRSLGSDLIVPLLRDDSLTGWIGIGGLAARYVTAELAAAFLAVGNQTVASLERIKAVEQARRREALALVGEMAAGLAHEVRNPVGAVRGAAEVLASESDPVRAREMLEVILEETARLGRVVGEFLDYARPLSPRRELVHLPDLVRRVLQPPGVSEGSGRTDLFVSPDTPPALGDPDQLRCAVENLLRNAREAAGPRGLLRVEMGPHAPDRVALRIEDNGPGIPPEEIPRLFQPFHTTKQRGTGLGLALVHRVVEAHGGEIQVEGRPGVGAVFTVLLPAAGAHR